MFGHIFPNCVHSEWATWLRVNFVENRLTIGRRQTFRTNAAATQLANTETAQPKYLSSIWRIIFYTMFFSHQNFCHFTQCYWKEWIWNWLVTHAIQLNNSNHNDSDIVFSIFFFFTRICWKCIHIFCFVNPDWFFSVELLSGGARAAGQLFGTLHICIWQCHHFYGHIRSHIQLWNNFPIYLHILG